MIFYEEDETHTPRPRPGAARRARIRKHLAARDEARAKKETAQLKCADPLVIILNGMDPPVRTPSEVGPQAIVAQATDPPVFAPHGSDPQVIILSGMDPPVTADSSSQRVL